MSEENNKKLNEQLVRCLLDDKIPNDIKLKKMDYIIRLGASIDAKDERGCSLLSLAKIMGNKEVISFLEQKGAKESGFNKAELEKFFRYASVEDINKFLNILPDGCVLDCDVYLYHKELKELPDFSRFIVNGNFCCDSNQLVSLEGAPCEVRGEFFCNNNQLVSLKGAPCKIGKSFHCYNNNLETLDGAPRIVGKVFDCDHNQLTSLEGAPRKVGGNFECRNNCLKTLKGAPYKVGGTFNCRRNPLESLRGRPWIIGGVLLYDEVANPVERFIINVYDGIKYGDW